MLTRMEILVDMDDTNGEIELLRVWIEKRMHNLLPDAALIQVREVPNPLT